MLGNFITLYQAGKATELHNLNALHQLPPGTPVVALSDPTNLLNGSLGKHVAYAIVSDTPGTLIMQQVMSDSEDGVIFQINEVRANSESRYFLHTTDNIDLSAVIQRAKKALGTRHTNILRSYPGDDFVYECMTGLNIFDIFAQGIEEIGQHWWTPLEVTPKQVLDDIQTAIRQKLANIPEKETIMEKIARKVTSEKLEKTLDTIQKVTPEMLLNIPLPQLEHHALLIEGNQCILFSEGAVRHMTKQDFCNTTPNTPIGGPAKGTPQAKIDVELRLFARNRAVRQLCHAGQGISKWGNFNFILNNSEHFSRYCRTGEASCTQLRDKTIAAVKAILGVILPGWLAMALNLTLDLFDLSPGKHATIN